jgi:hypothetical protein
MIDTTKTTRGAGCYDGRGTTWKESAAPSGVSVRTVWRIPAETDIATIDNAAECPTTSRATVNG